MERLPLEGWIEHHRAMGHHPVRVEPGAWSRENGYHTGSYTSEGHCDDCDGHKSIWRILTAEQFRQKFAHLKHHHPRRNLADDLPSGNPSGPPLQIADRYAAGRKHG